MSNRDFFITPQGLSDDDLSRLSANDNPFLLVGNKNLSDWSEESEEGQLAVDVYQDEKNIIVKSAIAGVKPDDIDISINNDMLTIRGRREGGKEINEDKYYYRECYWGGFSRSIVLPVEVAHDKIRAGLKNGILTITLPKAKKRHNIDIQIEDED